MMTVVYVTCFNIEYFELDDLRVVDVKRLHQKRGNLIEGISH